MVLQQKEETFQSEDLVLEISLFFKAACQEVSKKQRAFKVSNHSLRHCDKNLFEEFLVAKRAFRLVVLASNRLDLCKKRKPRLLIGFPHLLNQQSFLAILLRIFLLFAVFRFNFLLILV